jgi:hypothetical protein
MKEMETAGIDTKLCQTSHWDISANFNCVFFCVQWGPCNPCVINYNEVSCKNTSCWKNLSSSRHIIIRLILDILRTSKIKGQKPPKRDADEQMKECEGRIIEMKQRQKSKSTNKNVQWLFYNISQYQTWADFNSVRYLAILLISCPWSISGVPRGVGGSTPAPEIPKFWQSWAEFPVPWKIYP